MDGSSFAEIEKLEADLWSAADNLRANSKLTSSDYFMPVLGIIFLRHAENRFDVATRQIEEDKAAGRMPKRKVIDQDYVRRRALPLSDEARFDWIMRMATSGEKPLPTLVTDAMRAIEQKFNPLKGVLPKDYGTFEPQVLEDLMRLFNSEQIRQATGDVFGRIYEYFLARFSIQKAHNNGEFFTPSSLVQMLVNVIEPDHGKVFDPACGSGGMFVQSSHFIEQEGGDTAKKVVFYGQEKNPDTIRIAKMNLAVHGLTGEIGEAITYYEDQHNLVGGADFVMANPPFNVDLVDAERIKTDTDRLPFGLPGVNKQKKEVDSEPPTTTKPQLKAVEKFAPLAERVRGLVKQIDLLCKLAGRVNPLVASMLSDIDKISRSALAPGFSEKEPDANALRLIEADEALKQLRDSYDRRAVGRELKKLDEIRAGLIAQLRRGVYFHRQASWLLERFPDGKLVDVPGLVKLVSTAEIEAADWSLTPGRYVGVAPAEVDEDFDFEQTMHDIHVELADLNEEAVELAAKIQANYENLA